ncbi:hypothetical protein WISP_56309 [Willisornis vidua]|uniref:Uncharacterized protein n=1 Tax=Willisornis vidua TaxID=1566151 RepID=A0ABQ9DEX4_9PASS|nr:hypothetical protein WISP_56309 [Willisornis vidua]
MGLTQAGSLAQVGDPQKTTAGSTVRHLLGDSRVSSEAAAATKENWMLGCTQRDITNRDRDVTSPVYQVLVLSGHTWSLCPVLVSTVQEKTQTEWRGSNENHEDDQRL